MTVCQVFESQLAHRHHSNQQSNGVSTNCGSGLVRLEFCQRKTHPLPQVVLTSFRRSKSLASLVMFASLDQLSAESGRKSSEIHQMFADPSPLFSRHLPDVCRYFPFLPEFARCWQTFVQRAADIVTNLQTFAKNQPTAIVILQQRGFFVCPLEKKWRPGAASGVKLSD
jgi:hypothetical protein